MDFSGLLMLAGTLTYVGIMVYVANQIDAVRNVRTAAAYAPAKTRPGEPVRETWTSNPAVLRWLLFGLVGMIFILGLTVLQTALFSGLAAELEAQMPEATLPPVGLAGASITFVVATAAAFVSYRLTVSESARLMLQQVLNRWRGSFDPQSHVHLTAAVLVLAIAVWTLTNLILQGGIEGVAQDIEQNGLAAGDVIFQAVLEVVITLLGVGLAIRRGWPEALARLGLRWPVRQDVIWGVGLGFVLLIFMILFNLVWSLLVPPDVLQEQTSAAGQLNLAFATLPLAFILAVSAAVGEEIWIRGGLQPVFGIWVSSLFFAWLHMQLAFTPGMLLILVVSFILGWLRQRHSTTAAIIAHFFFNFVQLALLALAIEAV